MSERARILIIDDEEIVLESCREILGDEAYEVATVSDGAAGLRLLEDLDPDLVFVDLKMPGMSGFDVLEQIRELAPLAVPIVITGYATVSSAVEAMKRGAYDFLPKPFTPDEFRLITERGLEKRFLTLETMRLKQERVALRENFAAIVSHELKSPLAAVQQNLFVLEAQLGDTLDDDQRERLQRMKRRLDDLLELIHTWLRGFAVDLNGISERFESLSIAGPIADALESARPHAVRKNVELLSAVEPGVTNVPGDEVTLTEALLNIVSNAVKYSHDSGRVEVRARNSAHGVEISISDEGVGIAADDLPFIFKDFYRATPSRGAAPGYGIGLAISNRIVKAHGGSIVVNSELDRGSTFVITLPAAPPEATGAEEDPRSRLAAATSSVPGGIR
ncbi:MAG: response regulator [Acidobacteriota bacterium]|jgi:signal transduction histidine kinase